MTSRAPIRLFWAGGRSGDVNLGDALSPVIVSALSGREVIYAKPAHADLVAIGSVFERVWRKRWRRLLSGRFAPLAVWGAGTLAEGAFPCDRRFAVSAVRGPATRDALGLSAGTPLGDPGLLAPEVLGVTRGEARAALGLIPHFTDQDHPAVARFAQEPGRRVIDVREPDLRATLRAVAECEGVISTSLHGLIVADAMGVPNAWARLGDGVEGRGWKFQDYFASVGRETIPPLSAHDLSNRSRVETALVAAGRDQVAARIADLRRAFAALSLA